uniref:Uncharacterized protein n=1 Tax=Cannabis sativa TaxID=3483 RepID=A0A803RC52_CANSA
MRLLLSGFSAPQTPETATSEYGTTRSLNKPSFGSLTGTVLSVIPREFCPSTATEALLSMLTKAEALFFGQPMLRSTTQIVSWLNF